MPIDTRIIRVTATRCFLGQAVLEVPVWADDARIGGIVRRGGALASLLSRRIRFDRLDGTGLAACTIMPASATRSGELHLTLHDITPALRSDGLKF